MKTAKKIVFIIYSSILIISCKNYDDLLLDGLKLKEKKNYTEAIDKFSSAIELDPNNPRAIIARGISYSLNNQLDNSNKDFTSAIKLDYKNQLAYFNRANNYIKLGNFNAALEDFNNAYKYSKIDPTKKKLGILGQLDGFGEKPKTALPPSEYEFDIELPRILKERGLVNLELKNYKAAIIDFDEYTTYYQDTTIIYNNGIARINNNDTIGGCYQLNVAAKMGSKDVLKTIEKVCKYNYRQH